MIPVAPSLEGFTGQFRSLAPADRAAFVAGVLRAQGWDTGRDGCLIVATREDETRRVHVGPVPSDVGDADIDEVVIVPSRFEPLRTVLPGNADATVGDSGRMPDASVLDSATLHEQLLYAVDRERAERLYRDHFDADFYASDGGRDPGLGPSRRLAVAVVLLLAVSVALPVLAGVVPAGPLWGDTSPDGDRLVETSADPEVGAGAPVTPTPTPTPIPTGTTSLSPEEVQDPDRLARAHGRALEGHPVAMHAEFTGPRFLTGFDTRRSGFDPNDTVTIRAHVESDSQYHVVRRTNFTGSPFTSVRWQFERFADGRAEYRRFEGENSTEYQRRPLAAVLNGSESVATWTRFVLPRYLNTTRTEVKSIGTGTKPRYRLLATGEPLALDHETRDYRAVAVVTSDGWIGVLRVSYRHPDTGARVVVRVRYVRSPGAVESPGWYDEVTGRSEPESPLRTD
ncbi:MAG: hypothetical protein A07HR67_00761 [uncultured archaeon A07HR67]|nr:MAG: hypothetical protein A07HR67_00761 [uncultured archaeon A07HR67]